MCFNLLWVEDGDGNCDNDTLDSQHNGGPALDDDYGDRNSDDNGNAGGDPFNKTPFLTQPCRPRTWKSTSQSQDTVHICRNGTGAKLLTIFYLGLHLGKLLIIFGVY